MYEGFARRLESEGFSVLAYDHRGFGQSHPYAGLSRSQVSSDLKVAGSCPTIHSWPRAQSTECNPQWYHAPRASGESNGLHLS
eukprot:COSAG05_NODE_5162_length_1248_cov_1.758921_1_plen_83_part_00